MPLIIARILKLAKDTAAIGIAHIVEQIQTGRQMIYVDGVLIGQASNPIHGRPVIRKNDDFEEWPKADVIWISTVPVASCYVPQVGELIVIA